MPINDMQSITEKNEGSVGKNNQDQERRQSGCLEVVSQRNRFKSRQQVSDKIDAGIKLRKLIDGRKEKKSNRDDEFELATER